MTPGICLAAGALHAFVATTSFTLAWTHSIEKIRWEEDYVAHGHELILEEARIRGSGAGMEPPPGAVLRDGAWHYRPERAPLARVLLARSDFTPDYELCFDGRCHAMAEVIPAAGPTSLQVCER